MTQAKWPAGSLELNSSWERHHLEKLDAALQRRSSTVLHALDGIRPFRLAHRSPLRKKRTVISVSTSTGSPFKM
jgi:hypothetical protein